MSSSDAQKSEVHAVTGDASTFAESAPAAYPGGDNTSQTQAQEHSKPHPDAPGWDESARRPVEGASDATLVRDDTSDGGPLVIKSGDPDLNPPRVPQDPFPTDRKPEIDPPVAREGTD
jgi:hypothetical protein